MKTVIDILEAVQLNCLEVILGGVFFFFIGYYKGTRKVKKLNREIFQLENTLLDLSEEILQWQSDPNFRQRA